MGVDQPDDDLTLITERPPHPAMMFDRSAEPLVRLARDVENDARGDRLRYLSSPNHSIFSTVIVVTAGLSLCHGPAGRHDPQDDGGGRGLHTLGHAGADQYDYPGRTW
jgi:hypothetical protein